MVLNNLKTFFAAIKRLLDLGVIRLTTNLKKKSQLTVDQALQKVELKYMSTYIQSLMNSESTRLFDFLKNRAELVYE